MYAIYFGVVLPVFRLFGSYLTRSLLFYKFQVELLLFNALGFSQKPDLIHLPLEVLVRKQNKNESEGV